VADFMEPDRIVVGAEDERTAGILVGLYRSFPDTEMIVTNSRTAEMIKYASNSLLATMISFSNELANLGSALGGIDTVDVMRGVHASRYLTVRRPEGDVTAPLASFLFAGCGFGGSCLPKDVTALAAQGRSAGVQMTMLESVLAINAGQPAVLVDLARAKLGRFEGAKVGVLGLAFKPDTNDTRESPAFPVIRQIVSEGATVIAHDPVVEPHDMPADVVPLIDLRRDIASVVSSVDVLVLITSWGEYASLPEILSGMADPPPLVDGRRMIAADAVPGYSGIGLGR
jgi:UDPglucose 6-dehydrogenase/GDP-mannose 6-dehydrogenase